MLVNIAENYINLLFVISLAKHCLHLRNYAKGCPAKSEKKIRKTKRNGKQKKRRHRVFSKKHYKDKRLYGRKYNQRK